MISSKHNGFTLIELLIVLAIVGILLAFAIPAYGKFVERSRRSDAHNVLLLAAAAQERWFTNRNAYTNTLGDLLVGPNSENGWYRLTTQNGFSGNNRSFLLTATPQNVQANDDCGALSFDSAGTKTFAGAQTNGRCW